MHRKMYNCRNGHSLGNLLILQGVYRLWMGSRFLLPGLRSPGKPVHDDRPLDLFLSDFTLSTPPRTLVNLLRHAHICWELSQCVIASHAELFYQKREWKCLKCCMAAASKFTVSVYLRNETCTEVSHSIIFQSQNLSVARTSDVLLTSPPKSLKYSTIHLQGQKCRESS